MRKLPPSTGVVALLLTVVAVLISGCASPKPHPDTDVLRREVDACIGTPYRYGGDSKKGMDCSGLVVAVYRRAGVKLPHNVDTQYGIGDKVDRGDLIYGDVVFFNTEPGSGASVCFFPCIFLGFSVPYVYGRTHNGIYTGDNTFVHASSSRGVVRDNLGDKYWKKRYIGARRYLE